MSLAEASCQSVVTNADYRNILAPETDLTLPFGLFRPVAIHIESETHQTINIESESLQQINIMSESR